MPLKLISETPDESELRKFIVYLDAEKQDPWPSEEDGTPIGEGYEEVIFWLAMLPSRIANRINDQIFEYKRDGSSTLKVGTSTEKKLLAAVKKWEGVVDAHGNPAPVTLKALQALPTWVQQEVIMQVNEMNNLTEVERQD